MKRESLKKITALAPHGQVFGAFAIEASSRNRLLLIDLGTDASPGSVLYQPQTLHVYHNIPYKTTPNAKTTPDRHICQSHGVSAPTGGGRDHIGFRDPGPCETGGTGGTAVAVGLRGMEEEQAALMLDLSGGHVDG